jgi:hypothetical protein
MTEIKLLKKGKVEINWLCTWPLPTPPLTGIKIEMVDKIKYRIIVLVVL